MRLGTKNREAVTQADIDHFLGMQRSLEELKRRVEELKAGVDATESDLIARIERGARLQCNEQISLKTTTRVFPKWKEAFLARLGEQEAAKVAEATPKTIYRHLVVQAIYQRKSEAA